MATNTITAATQLLRGTNIQVQDMQTTYAQRDDSNSFKGWGLQHQVLAGLDLAHAQFKTYALATPAGVTLNKNAVPGHPGRTQ